MCITTHSKVAMDKIMSSVGLEKQGEGGKKLIKLHKDLHSTQDSQTPGGPTAWAKLLSSLGLARKPTWPEPQYDPVYRLAAAPSALDARQPGDVLEVRSIQLQRFPGLNGTKIKAFQIAYVTTDGQEVKQVTVTTVAIPVGNKVDRVVSMQSKADGATSSCRTSYAFRKGGNARFASLSESPFLAVFLAQGWAINMPDMSGQYDAFGDGPTAGRATLDSLRALDKAHDALGLQSIDAGLKIALWGYSGGAQATFWAAQTQTVYAPKLADPIVGYAGGGLPVELGACGLRINKTYAAGLILGLLAGLANVHASFAEFLKVHVTPKGNELFEIARTKCWYSYMIAGFKKDIFSREYFDVDDPLSQPPVKSMLEQMTLGRNVTGDAYPKPMWLMGSLGDEVIPPEQAQSIADYWVSKGASVELTQDETPGHALLCFTGFPVTLHWLRARFDGLPPAAAPGTKVVHQVKNSLLHLDQGASDEHLSARHLALLKKAAELFKDLPTLF